MKLTLIPPASSFSLISRGVVFRVGLLVLSTIAIAIAAILFKIISNFFHCMVEASKLTTPQMSVRERLSIFRFLYPLPEAERENFRISARAFLEDAKDGRFLIRALPQEERLQFMFEAQRLVIGRGTTGEEGRLVFEMDRDNRILMFQALAAVSAKERGGVVSKAVKMFKARRPSVDDRVFVFQAFCNASQDERDAFWISALDLLEDAKDDPFLIKDLPQEERLEFMSAAENLVIGPKEVEYDHVSESYKSMPIGRRKEGEERKLVFQILRGIPRGKKRTFVNEILKVIPSVRMNVENSMLMFQALAAVSEQERGVLVSQAVEIFKNQRRVDVRVSVFQALCNASLEERERFIPRASVLIKDAEEPLLRLLTQFDLGLRGEVVKNCLEMITDDMKRNGIVQALSTVNTFFHGYLSQVMASNDSGRGNT